jgi:hypothetical protein
MRALVDPQFHIVHQQGGAIVLPRHRLMCWLLWCPVHSRLTVLVKVHIAQRPLVSDLCTLRWLLQCFAQVSGP